MLAFILASLMLFSPQDDPIVGSWLGALKTPGGELRIVFNISRSNGELTGTIDIPDQGAFGIPVDEVSLVGGAFHLAVNSIGASYDGSLNDAGVLNGFWKQGGVELALGLKKTEEVPTLNRPQTPEPPFPYKEESIRFLNAKDQISLAGTLLIPEGDGPFPAVAFCTGSGPQDRDETIFGHKPFWVIADFLSRNGIATLRYDDRGVGESGGDYLTATSVDFATDLEAAISYLESREEIDSNQVGAIGHSEGGLVAPMIANRTPGLDFAILLAPPGVSGEEIVVSQSEAIARLSGGSEKNIAENTELQHALFAVLREGLDAEAEREKMEGILRDAIGNQPRAIEAQISQLTAPWMRGFLVYDPEPALKEMSCPALALIGEKDLQVLPRVNIPAIQAAFGANPNEHLVVKEIPGVNHIFQTATTGLPAEYSKIDETVAPIVLTQVLEWINATVAG